MLAPRNREGRLVPTPARRPLPAAAAARLRSAILTAAVFGSAAFVQTGCEQPARVADKKVR